MLVNPGTKVSDNLLDLDSSARETTQFINGMAHNLLMNGLFEHAGTVLACWLSKFNFAISQAFLKLLAKMLP